MPTKDLPSAQSKSVPLSRLDTTDDTFRITTRTSVDDLLASLRHDGMLNPPLDKFLAFSMANIQASEKNIDAAYASLQEAREVVEQFQLKTLEIQVQMVHAIISEAEGDFAAMAEHFLKAIERINHSVVAAEVQTAVPKLYSEIARAQIEIGSLGAAEKSIEAGFRLDPSEPMLWVAKARLQQARNMPRMALASVNYALAIWKDADEDYVQAKIAWTLAAELQSKS